MANFEIEIVFKVFGPKFLLGMPQCEEVVENVILIAFLGGLISSLRNNKSGRRIRSVTSLEERRSSVAVKDAFWEVKTFKNMTFFDNDKREEAKDHISLSIASSKPFLNSGQKKFQTLFDSF